jgi:hypothetical protein
VYEQAALLEIKTKSEEVSNFYLFLFGKLFYCMSLRCLQLFAAVKTGNLEAVRECLQNGANVYNKDEVIRR